MNYFGGRIWRVFDWAERFQMAVEVQKYDEEKLFKIAKLNLHGKMKD